ncbi:hypothetical protein [Lapillicoccus sp.]|uniref:hypothetical protein n=1 Tax=Lapillicoccus sp. TaxID=1909287 RepID=UPI00398380A9
MVVRFVAQTHATAVEHQTGFTAGGRRDAVADRPQAGSAAGRTTSGRVGHVWVSDLAGAVETATIAFAGLAGLADPADRRGEPGGCRKTVSRWLSAAEAERRCMIANACGELQVGDGDLQVEKPTRGYLGHAPKN